ncbi:bis(5'-nucleosyl)-tetraphosphatase (symmetrical) YqeK [Desmospora profundinema]|uniref:bis(5'-nucleosyl)-tetraphosphatase (symmetrical) n=1 Tax=Desmospora profundinema TaxID=1571184 RepID=A0ABU1ILT3_9BACL|nr:bis(5'-nucleosyl)-tetraphosphatase (symmetrical) YqeK [Desmospora profundinema]MDR6225114.1 putative HD superfamily hydrolase involved in NAD metabolism [Desmospora profundinema]
MNRADWREAVRAQMPRTRWEHTLRVVDTAKVLAERFGADVEKAETAALLHDYCKFWPVGKMRRMIWDKGLPRDLLEHNTELWHAFVGAEAVREELGVGDDEILNAIRYHTSGRPHMSLLEQVIFVADVIEPGRRYPGVDEIRKLAETDLERALLQSLDNTLRFLIDRCQKVYPLTLAARNDLVDRVHRPNLKEESL